MITKTKKGEAAAKKIADAANRQAILNRGINACILPEDREALIGELLMHFERNAGQSDRTLFYSSRSLAGARAHTLISHFFAGGPVYVTSRSSKGYQMTGSPDGIWVDHLRRGGETITWEQLIEANDAEDDENPSATTREAQVSQPAAAVPAAAGDDASVRDAHSSNGKKPHRSKTTASTSSAQTSGPPAAADAATTSAGSAAPGGFFVTLDPSYLAPNPFQPRHDFEPDALNELADSLDSNGQLQSILVRPDPADATRYQIADGERRWRAAKQIGLKLTCVVRELSDEQMAKVAVEANRQRRDLNAIEEARQFQMLMVRFAWSQKRIGEEFGIADTQVSNRLRLLALPEKWLKRVESAKLPPSHARSLARYAKYPAILEVMDRVGFDPSPTLEDWDDELERAVEQNIRPLEGHYWDGRGGQKLVAFKPTPEQIAELDVAEIKNMMGGKMKRALNVVRWNELQAEGERARAEREAKAAAKRTASGKPAKKVEPAASRVSNRITSPPADVLKKRLTEWRFRWFSYLVERHLAKPVAKGTLPRALAAPLRTILYLATRHGSTLHGMNEALRQVAKARGLKATSSWNGTDAWKVLGEEDPAKLNDLAVDVVRACLYRQDEGPINNCISYPVVECLVEDLGIDLAAAWRAELGGPLTEEFFNHHTRDQLADLAKHWGADVGDAKTKAATVASLTGHARTREKLPPSLSPKKTATKKTQTRKGAKSR